MARGLSAFLIVLSTHALTSSSEIHSCATDLAAQGCSDDSGDNALFVFPPMFTANVTRISHFIAHNQMYPPWKTTTEVWYDGLAQKVKYSVLSGLQTGSLVLRDWNAKDEFVFSPVDAKLYDCQRGFLSEEFVPFFIPLNMSMQQPGVYRLQKRVYPSRENAARVVDDGDGVVRSESELFVNVSLWVLQSSPSERYRIYIDKATKYPIRVTSESSILGFYQPVATWTFDSFSIPTQGLEEFQMPAPWNRTSCPWRLGGWPSNHLFAHFLRV